MRSTIAMATFAALAAGTAGVSALDNAPNFAGSDTLKNMTQDVLVECGANCAGLNYIGTGSGNGQTNLNAGTQGVAPMSRALNNGVCSNANRTKAEGLVVALDGVNVIGMDTNVCNSATQGLQFDPAVANSWRDVLRSVYAGMPAGTSTDPTIRDCNSAARRALIASWDDLFRGSCANCADSNPDSAVAEPGLRHAFRRDEESGTTDVFLGLLSLGTISFTQAPPTNATYPATATKAYRALANSPFCNVKRPNDSYLAVTVPANATAAQILAGTAKVIPPAFNIGAAPAGAGGFDHDSNPATPAQLRSLISDPLDDFGDDVSFPEMQDQDPVRRKCVSDNFDTLAGQVKPTEQVCSADGQLGVVLPINPPPIGNAIAYPNVICDAGSYEFGPGVQNAFFTGIRCPNGDEPLGAPAQCRLPIAPDGKFNCLNGGGTWLGAGGALFAANGAPAVIDGDTAGETMGRTNVDGRVYNHVLRDAAGNPIKILRPNPAALGNVNTPLVGSFYRIHSTRSLLASAATKTCQRDDATEQLGCLVQASPCSLAYAGGDSVTQNPGGTIGIRVSGVLPDITSIQNLVTQAGPVYPFARKLYVNTLRGFDQPLAPFTGSDGETDMVRSFVTETIPADATHVGATFGGSLPASFGFFPLPGGTGPFCEDFNENGVCGTTGGVCTTTGTRTVCTAVNSNACAPATTVAGIPDNTAFCGNGVVDTGEACDDGNAITDTAVSPADPTDDKCSVNCTVTP